MIRMDLIAPVAELLERQARRFPDKVAYQDAARAITYAELNRQVANLATHLRAGGLKDGDTVALWLPNSVDWIVGCFATLRAGGISVPISYDATKPEAAYRLDDAACGIVITKTERGAVLAEIAPSSRRMMTDGEDAEFRALCAAPAPGVTLVPDDIERPAYIVYTSGTTGRAKGTILTTRGMLWITAACWAPILGLSEDDTVLSPLPLFHSYALNISVLGILATGANEFIMERFSTQGALDHLASGKFTLMPGVPTTFNYLLQAARAAGVRTLPGLERCVSAGAILPGTLNREFEEYFGVELLDGYGITETSTMVTMNWRGQNRVPGSCGLPVPGLAVRIVNPATGLDVPFGAEGELITRGPNLMLGYHNKPNETAAALRDGWYRTGDLARSDKNGFLTITGRLKEIIIRGGQNIAPAEIEEVILPLEAIKDCAVVGMPHAMLGEVPVAFVVAKDGMAIDVEALLAHCRTMLSSYKVPVAIHTVAEIPRTGSGKIMRFKLRELIEQPAA
jgi:long-chain acyl-CoA synthetase